VPGELLQEEFPMNRATAAADELFDMRRHKRPVAALPPDCAPRTLAEGYEVQEKLVARLMEHFGSEPIGYKIACTSVLAQKALGVDGPFFGVLLSHSTHVSPAELPGGDFLVRCAEAEFAFQMAHDVPPGFAFQGNLIAPFVGPVVPGIEIVDHRYLDWQTVGAPSLLADNAIHGAWVRGEPNDGWRALDLAAHPTLLTVNEEQKFPGSGAAVLGHPLNVVAWLADELHKYGRRLRRGDYVTTGITTGIYLARAGDRLDADFGPLGSARLGFAAG
jgi:2-keto-4-pentenoate hydratase